MESKHGAGKKHYVHLGIMAGLSFVAMYVLMYAMVASTRHVYNNVNQVYMAGLMTAPMVVIELIVMRAMYHDRRLNLIIMVIAVVSGIAMWVGIRTQAAVSDRQFLRSMIPHHSSAILMCEQASLNVSEIKALCEAIQSSQQREIDQMISLLQR